MIVSIRDRVSVSQEVVQPQVGGAPDASGSACSKRRMLIIAARTSSIALVVVTAICSGVLDDPLWLIGTGAGIVSTIIFFKCSTRLVTKPVALFQRVQQTSQLHEASVVHASVSQIHVPIDTSTQAEASVRYQAPKLRLQGAASDVTILPVDDNQAPEIEDAVKKGRRLTIKFGPATPSVDIPGLSLTDYTPESSPEVKASLSTLAPQITILQSLALPISAGQKHARFSAAYMSTRSKSGQQSSTETTRSSISMSPASGIDSASTPHSDRLLASPSLLSSSPSLKLASPLVRLPPLPDEQQRKLKSLQIPNVLASTVLRKKTDITQ